jgi:transcriptional regulator with XRE-family HTH domain
MKINIEAGKTLKLIREKLKIPRTQAAKISGIGESTIKSWENGNIDLASRRFDTYSKFLKNYGYDITLESIFQAPEYDLISPQIDEISYIRHMREDKILLSEVIGVITRISDFCYFVDSNENILYFNKKAPAFLSLDCKILYQVQYPKLKDLCTTDTYETCFAHYQIALEDKEICFDYSTTVNPSRDSSFLTIPYSKMRYIPLHNAHNNVIGVLSLLIR